MVINKIKYYLYSQPYKKIYTNKEIDKIKSSSYICFGRQNGKTLISYKLYYIRAVENYNFKFAKNLRKNYKKIFQENIF